MLHETQQSGDDVPVRHLIELDLDASGRGRVFLDGAPLDCMGICIDAEAGQAAHVSLRIKARIQGRLEIHRLTTTPSPVIPDSIWKHFIGESISVPLSTTEPPTFPSVHMPDPWPPP